MKKLIAIAASAAFLAGVTISAQAHDKAMEGKCKEMATKDKVATDKMDAYMKECMKKMGDKGMGMDHDKGMGMDKDKGMDK